MLILLIRNASHIVTCGRQNWVYDYADCESGTV